MFKTIHPDLLGHHITYMFGADSVVPPEAKIFVVGECITDKVQCFVVEIDGSIVRKDGKIYHLTWSIDKSKGAKPVDSNSALMSGFTHLSVPIEIYGIPKSFKF